MENRKGSSKTKMAIKVYGMDLSAPVRMVMMTCEALGIEYELITVNLMEGEHKRPEFLKVSVLDSFN